MGDRGPITVNSLNYGNPPHTKAPLNITNAQLHLDIDNYGFDGFDEYDSQDFHDSDYEDYEDYDSYEGDSDDQSGFDHDQEYDLYQAIIAESLERSGDGSGGNDDNDDDNDIDVYQAIRDKYDMGNGDRFHPDDHDLSVNPVYFKGEPSHPAIPRSPLSAAQLQQQDQQQSQQPQQQPRQHQQQQQESSQPTQRPHSVDEHMVSPLPRSHPIPHVNASQYDENGVPIPPIIPPRGPLYNPFLVGDLTDVPLFGEGLFPLDGKTPFDPNIYLHGFCHQWKTNRSRFSSFYAPLVDGCDHDHNIENPSSHHNQSTHQQQQSKVISCGISMSTHGDDDNHHRITNQHDMKDDSSVVNPSLCLIYDESPRSLDMTVSFIPPDDSLSMNGDDKGNDRNDNESDSYDDYKTAHHSGHYDDDNDDDFKSSDEYLINELREHEGILVRYDYLSKKGFDLPSGLVPISLLYTHDPSTPLLHPFVDIKVVDDDDECLLKDLNVKDVDDPIYLDDYRNDHRGSKPRHSSLSSSKTIVAGEPDGNGYIHVDTTPPSQQQRSNSNNQPHNTSTTGSIPFSSSSQSPRMATAGPTIPHSINSASHHHSVPSVNANINTTSKPSIPPKMPPSDTPDALSDFLNFLPRKTVNMLTMAMANHPQDNQIKYYFFAIRFVPSFMKCIHQIQLASQRLLIQFYQSNPEVYYPSHQTLYLHRLILSASFRLVLDLSQQLFQHFSILRTMKMTARKRRAIARREAAEAEALAAAEARSTDGLSSVVRPHGEMHDDYDDEKLTHNQPHPQQHSQPYHPQQQHSHHHSQQQHQSSSPPSSYQQHHSVAIAASPPAPSSPTAPPSSAATTPTIRSLNSILSHPSNVYTSSTTQSQLQLSKNTTLYPAYIVSPIKIDTEIGHLVNMLLSSDPFLVEAWLDTSSPCETPLYSPAEILRRMDHQVRQQKQEQSNPSHKTKRNQQGATTAPMMHRTPHLHHRYNSRIPTSFTPSPKTSYPRYKTFYTPRFMPLLTPHSPNDKRDKQNVIQSDPFGSHNRDPRGRGGRNSGCMKNSTGGYLNRKGVSGPAYHSDTFVPADHKKHYSSSSRHDKYDDSTISSIQHRQNQIIVQHMGTQPHPRPPAVLDRDITLALLLHTYRTFQFVVDRIHKIIIPRDSELLSRHIELQREYRHQVELKRALKAQSRSKSIAQQLPPASLPYHSEIELSSLPPHQHQQYRYQQRQQYQQQNKHQHKHQQHQKPPNTNELPEIDPSSYKTYLQHFYSLHTRFLADLDPIYIAPRHVTTKGTVIINRHFPDFTFLNRRLQYPDASYPEQSQTASDEARSIQDDFDRLITVLDSLQASDDDERYTQAMELIAKTIQYDSPFYTLTQRKILLYKHDIVGLFIQELSTEQDVLYQLHILHALIRFNRSSRGYVNLRLHDHPELFQYLMNTLRLPIISQVIEHAHRFKPSKGFLGSQFHRCTCTNRGTDDLLQPQFKRDMARTQMRELTMDIINHQLYVHEKQQEYANLAVHLKQINELYPELPLINPYTHTPSKVSPVSFTYYLPHQQIHEDDMDVMDYSYSDDDEDDIYGDSEDYTDDYNDFDDLSAPLPHLPDYYAQPSVDPTTFRHLFIPHPGQQPPMVIDTDLHLDYLEYFLDPENTPFPDYPDLFMEPPFSPYAAYDAFNFRPRRRINTNMDDDSGSYSYSYSYSSSDSYSDSDSDNDFEYNRYHHRHHHRSHHHHRLPVKSKPKPEPEQYLPGERDISLLPIHVRISKLIALGRTQRPPPPLTTPPPYLTSPSPYSTHASSPSQRIPTHHVFPPSITARKGHRNRLHDYYTVQEVCTTRSLFHFNRYKAPIAAVPATTTQRTPSSSSSSSTLATGTGQRGDLGVNTNPRMRAIPGGHPSSSGTNLPSISLQNNYNPHLSHILVHPPTQPRVPTLPPQHQHLNSHPQLQHQQQLHYQQQLLLQQQQHRQQNQQRPSSRQTPQHQLTQQQQLMQQHQLMQQQQLQQRHYQQQQQQKVHLQQHQLQQQQQQQQHTAHRQHHPQHHPQQPQSQPSQPHPQHRRTAQPSATPAQQPTRRKKPKPLTYETETTYYDFTQVAFEPSRARYDSFLCTQLNEIRSSRCYVHLQPQEKMKHHHHLFYAVLCLINWMTFDHHDADLLYRGGILSISSLLLHYEHAFSQTLDPTTVISHKPLEWVTPTQWRGDYYPPYEDYSKILGGKNKNASGTSHTQQQQQQQQPKEVDNTIRIIPIRSPSGTTTDCVVSIRESDYLPSLAIPVFQLITQLFNIRSSIIANPNIFYTVPYMYTYYAERMYEVALTSTDDADDESSPPATPTDKQHTENTPNAHNTSNVPQPQRQQQPPQPQQQSLQPQPQPLQGQQPIQQPPLPPIHPLPLPPLQTSSGIVIVTDPLLPVPTVSGLPGLNTVIPSPTPPTGTIPPGFETSSKLIEHNNPIQIINDVYGFDEGVNQNRLLHAFGLGRPPPPLGGSLGIGTLGGVQGAPMGGAGGGVGGFLDLYRPHQGNIPPQQQPPPQLQQQSQQQPQPPLQLQQRAQPQPQSQPQQVQLRQQQQSQLQPQQQSQLQPPQPQQQGAGPGIPSHLLPQQQLQPQPQQQKPHPQQQQQHPQQQLQPQQLQQLQPHPQQQPQNTFSLTNHRPVGQNRPAHPYKPPFPQQQQFNHPSHQQQQQQAYNQQQHQLQQPQNQHQLQRQQSQHQLPQQHQQQQHQLHHYQQRQQSSSQHPQQQQSSQQYHHQPYNQQHPLPPPPSFPRQLYSPSKSHRRRQQDQEEEQSDEMTDSHVIEMYDDADDDDDDVNDPPHNNTRHNAHHKPRHHNTRHHSTRHHDTRHNTNYDTHGDDKTHGDDSTRDSDNLNDDIDTFIPLPLNLGQANRASPSHDGFSISPSVVSTVQETRLNRWYRRTPGLGLVHYDNTSEELELFCLSAISSYMLDANVVTFALSSLSWSIRTLYGYSRLFYSAYDMSELIDRINVMYNLSRDIADVRASIGDYNVYTSVNHLDNVRKTMADFLKNLCLGKSKQIHSGTGPSTLPDLLPTTPVLTLEDVEDENFQIQSAYDVLMSFEPAPYRKPKDNSPPYQHCPPPYQPKPPKPQPQPQQQQQQQRQYHRTTGTKVNYQQHQQQYTQQQQQQLEYDRQIYIRRQSQTPPTESFVRRMETIAENEDEGKPIDYYS